MKINVLTRVAEQPLVFAGVLLLPSEGYIDHSMPGSHVIHMPAVGEPCKQQVVRQVATTVYRPTGCDIVPGMRAK